MEERVLKSDYEGRTLAHYGTLTFSGRYPWGSGENPYQRLQDFRGFVQKLKKEGLSEKEIADACGMTINDVRDHMTISTAEKRVHDVRMAQELKDKGWSNTAIGERMGVPESTVRNLLKPGADEKARKITNITDSLRSEIAEKGFIDIGADSNRYLHTTKTRMDACLSVLKDEGYHVWWAKVQQAGTGKYTNMRILAPPDAEYPDFKAKFDMDPSIVKPIGFCSDDGGDSINKLKPPLPISRDRILVRYAEDGGEERDGVIQIRPGVEDLDLLGARYAQVRVSVDDKMYMKGMAIYDDIPDGYDVVYNTNKKRGTPDEKVFKPMYEKGEDEPFSASIKTKRLDDGQIVYQKDYIGKDGKLHRSALNIVNEEGDWGEWSKTIASQMLSKQSTDLAKKQLGIAAKSRQDEYDEIMSLTNPTIKKKLLDQLAESCDADAVELKAAAMPRQASQVLIPVPSMKDTEIYAPNYRNGETVVLIRYPHGGTFEIPQLKVNNKQPDAKKLLGQARDGVGINKHVADQLSGADFDGDSVLVIPNNDGAISASSPLAQLKNFNPKSYKLPDDSPELKRPKAKRERTKQMEMGKVSNLITDMTIKGASTDEIARAVKHSMVVIDSVKHDLDYKQSEKDNRIQELRDKYQGGGGASTLISKASSSARPYKRREITSTSIMTEDELKRYKAGEKIYRRVMETEKVTLPSGRTTKVETDQPLMQKKRVVDAEGNVTWVRTNKPVTQESVKMRETKDARTLSSGTAMEEIYADYANEMKALANKARASSRSTPLLQQSPSAKQVYADELETLNAKLNTAKMNAPRERAAQRIADARVKAQIRDNPSLKEDKDALQKAKNKALIQARNSVGSSKKDVQIVLTDREWDAIQAGAISDSKLKEILDNTDMDDVRRRATPRANAGLSSAQESRAKAMAARGMTQADIADALGVSTSVVNKVING